MWSWVSDLRRLSTSCGCSPLQTIIMYWITYGVIYLWKFHGIFHKYSVKSKIHLSALNSMHILHHRGYFHPRCNIKKFLLLMLLPLVLGQMKNAWVFQPRLYLLTRLCGEWFSEANVEWMFYLERWLLMWSSMCEANFSSFSVTNLSNDLHHILCEPLSHNSNPRSSSYFSYCSCGVPNLVPLFISTSGCYSSTSRDQKN